MLLEPLFIPYLKEDEKIIWTGQPKRGVQLRDADMLLIPMSIILVGFSLILNYTLLYYESPFTLKIIGVMLALASVYMCILRFFLSARKRARTFYCITNKRVLLKNERKKLNLKTLPLKNIERLDLTEEKDGSGFIILGNTNPLYPWLLGGFYFVQEALPGLAMLPNVKEVYDILYSLVKINITPSLLNELNKEDQKDWN
ncbi:MAG: hypothetical protein H0W62_11265 [Chitinophagales bacterium]|nr:hypothetical protein [Chitinophagales bacterium]